MSDEQEAPFEASALARAMGSGKKAQAGSGGNAFIGLGIVLLIAGFIGFFVGGMTVKSFLEPIVVVAFIVAALGVLAPLPFFAFKRIVALGTGLVLLVVAIPFVMSLRTPEEVTRDSQRTVAEEAEREGSYDDVEANPERYITLDYDSDGAGSISGNMANRSPYGITNVKLRCDQQGSNGKRLDRSSITISKSVPANGSVTFGPLFVDYMDQQAVRMDCRPVDADIVN